MEKLAIDLGGAVRFRRLAGSFLECVLTPPGGEVVEMDFAVDAPFRFAPRRVVDELGIEVDDVMDIAAATLREGRLLPRLIKPVTLESGERSSRGRPAG